MKSLVICALVAVVGVVLAAPQNVQNAQNIRNAQDVQLLRYDSDNDGLGTYSFVYEQSQRHNANGELRNAGAENAFVTVKGSYSWLAPDGTYYTVNYIADENGYQPTILQSMGFPMPSLESVPSAVVATLLG